MKFSQHIIIFGFLPFQCSFDPCIHRNVANMCNTAYFYHTVQFISNSKFSFKKKAVKMFTDIIAYLHTSSIYVEIPFFNKFTYLSTSFILVTYTLY